MEQIILVDEKDKPLGFEEKLRAHENGGKLHRAFSIFVFNSEGKMLLQLRSVKKHHFGGLWTNSVCSHPRKGEELGDAVHRRLKDEFGFDAPLKEAFSFVYKALDKKSGLTEHEFDHVFVGKFDGVPKPNATEIDEFKWVAASELRSDVRKNPEKYTPWFKLALERVLEKNQ
jgi:isopentenyl-diphosphate delta-isomerase